MVGSTALEGPPDVERVRAALAAAPHRGESHETLVTGRCVLGVSNGRERQDASLWSDERLAVAVNGRVDNLGELAAELGCDPGASPAEVLCRLFTRYGDSASSRMRGVFSGAVSDGRSLLGFRDHLGFGTLYFRESDGRFLLATEAKQVVAGAGITREPDPEVVARIFYRDYDDDEAPCALRGVSRVAKGSTVASSGGPVRRRRYWDPGSVLETARYAPAELQERFDALMGQAVARTLEGSTVVALSGGIDSPAVAAYGVAAARAAGTPFAALTYVYPDHPAVDESDYVRQVVAALDLPLEEHEQKAAPLDRMREWLDLVDGPVPAAALPHYDELYRTARGLGHDTVLTGEYAEFVADMSPYLIAHLVGAGRLSAALRQAQVRHAAGTRRRALAKQALSPAVPSAWTAYRLRQRASGIPSWLDPRRATAGAVASLVSPRRRWSAVQVGPFTGPAPAVEADDICQELAGVRARRPFADVDLWELFLSLPAEVKFPGPRTKELLRQLLRGRVPDVILDRRDKTYFDDSVLSRIDYPGLRALLVQPEHRLPGVDYRALEEHLEKEDLGLMDFVWAKDLAVAHGFLSLW